MRTCSLLWRKENKSYHSDETHAFLINEYTGLAVINSCTTDKNWPIIMQTGSPIKSNGPRQNKYCTYWSRKKYVQPHLPPTPPLFHIKTFLTYPSWTVTAYPAIYILLNIPCNTFKHFHTRPSTNSLFFVTTPNVIRTIAHLVLILSYFFRSFRSFIQFLSFLSELRIFQFLTVTWEIAGILN